jgi:hypothetical protein
MSKLDNKVKTARTAGIWYLAFIVLGFAGMAMIGENATTNILNADTTVQFGIIASILGYVCYLFLVGQLFKLFKSTSKNLALLMTVFVIAGVAIALVGLLGAGERIGFTATVFWGLWLIPLSILMLKSKLFPKFIAVLLLIGAVAHIANFFIYYFIPSIATPDLDNILSLVAIGEFVFVFYLLIKGVKKS